MSDLDTIVVKEIRNAIAGAARKLLEESYSSPLKPIIQAAVEARTPELRAVMDDAVKAVVLDDEFRTQVLTAVRHKVAKELVNSFGEGVFKKAVDQMKGDPTIRARCILAVEEIVAQALRKEIQ